MGGVLEALTSSNVEDVLGFLARRPFDNVYVTWLIATRQIGRTGDVVIWRDDANEIAGTCYFGPQIVPNAESDHAIEAFAERVRDAPATRMFVGPRDMVERLWSRTASAFARPAAIRTSQPVYALREAVMQPMPPGMDVARAEPGELDELAPHSARMIAGEIGGDPNRATAEHRARTARIIDHGWSWRARVAGRLVFMCNVGSASPYTAQLQGVWTPPDMRGHGYATQALAAICARLLREHASLSLYVNDFNTPAIALYERVGFERVGEFQTILLT